MESLLNTVSKSKSRFDKFLKHNDISSEKNSTTVEYSLVEQNKWLAHELKSLNIHLSKLIQIKADELKIHKDGHQYVEGLSMPHNRFSDQSYIMIDNGKLIRAVQEYREKVERLKQISNIDYLSQLKERKIQAETHIELLTKKKIAMEFAQKKRDKYIAKAVQGGGRPEVLSAMQKNHYILVLVKAYCKNIDLKLKDFDSKLSAIKIEKVKQSEEYNSLIEECNTLNIDVEDCIHTTSPASLVALCSVKTKLEIDIKSIGSKKKLIETDLATKQKILREEHEMLVDKAEKLRSKYIMLTDQMNINLNKAKQRNMIPDEMMEGSLMEYAIYIEIKKVQI